MKNTFSVTIQMTSAEQLANFINEIGPLVETVTITTTPVVRQALVGNKQVFPPNKPASPPKARTSKVNTTILDVLAEGPRTVKQLKDALEGAGMSAGSLSTGLAALQKAREVERVGEGLYGLVGMKAAAE